MRLKVYYEDGEPTQIKSVKASLDVEIDGETAIFNDPSMRMFSDNAIDEFVSDVKSLPFISETVRDYSDRVISDE